MLPWPSLCFLPHAQLLGFALGRRVWDVSADAAKQAHKRYRAMGHVLPRQVLHGSMGSWHTVAEREGKQGSPSYSKLNLESVQGMDHWQTYLTVAPQQGACNSRACKSAFSIKKGSNFGPVFGARNWSQKWVQNLNHLALV